MLGFFGNCWSLPNTFQLYKCTQNDGPEKSGPDMSIRKIWSGKVGPDMSGPEMSGPEMSVRICWSGYVG
jgi:hypothetical protein